MSSSPDVNHSDIQNRSAITTNSAPVQENIYSTSDDDFISSGDDFPNSTDSPEEQRHLVGYGASLSEHAEYFTKTISHALDSVEMDRSLVVQAQLSGHINNKNQQLIEKKQELLQKLKLLNQLHEKHIASNRLGQLEKDIKHLSTRLGALKNGIRRTLILGKRSTLGVAQKYPVEYNQAKDRVLERDYEDL